MTTVTKFSDATIARPSKAGSANSARHSCFKVRAKAGSVRSALFVFLSLCFFFQSCAIFSKRKPATWPQQMNSAQHNVGIHSKNLFSPANGSHFEKICYDPETKLLYTEIPQIRYKTHSKADIHFFTDQTCAQESTNHKIAISIIPILASQHAFLAYAPQDKNSNLVGMAVAPWLGYGLGLIAGWFFEIECPRHDQSDQIDSLLMEYSCTGEGF